MRIAKALKRKNQLAGEISKLGDIIVRQNVQLNENASRFNVKECYEQYKQKADDLVALKTGIARANADVWEKIFRIVELKGRITFLKRIDTKEGSFMERDYSQMVQSVYTPALDAKFIQDEITAIENQIADLQDEVDEYNHSRSI
jgi:replicative superfamily II helicase